MRETSSKGVANLVIENERQWTEAKQQDRESSHTEEEARLRAALESGRAATAARRASYLARARSLLDDDIKLQQQQQTLKGSRQRISIPEAEPSQCDASGLARLCSLSPASSTPLVYVLESFLTDAECDHLVALGKRQVKLLTKMQPLLQAMAAGVLDENVDQDPGKMIEWRPCSAPDAVARDIEERIGRLMGSLAHDLDGGVKLARTLSSPGFDITSSLRATDGAHVDTNRHEHRWGTCICYLTDLDELDGGETCFPIAGSASTTLEPASAALASDASAALASDATAALASDASMMIRTGYHHTGEALGDGRKPVADAAARILEASERCARGEGGLAVRPRKGTACIFYTRGEDAEVDPLSFHFGAAVLTPGKEKWTCQIFKALPEAARMSVEERRAFMRRVHPRVHPRVLSRAEAEPSSSVPDSAGADHTQSAAMAALQID